MKINRLGDKIRDSQPDRLSNRWHIIVSGHSLGSTTATLAGAYAAQSGWFNTVKTYVSASPMVGDTNFVEWYNHIKDNDLNLLGENTWRLTNTADGVPKEPNASAPEQKRVFREVGGNYYFTADYGDGAKNHNPCCTYSYALHNVADPINPDLTCNFPVDQNLRDAEAPEFVPVTTNIPRITRKLELVTYRGSI